MEVIRMGIYLDPGNTDFQMAVNSEIYVDKSKMITLTNKIINSENRFVCVSRPRRFGKSMAANMLAAYYSRGCDSRELFSKLKIAKADSFEKHLNQYHVIHINMANFIRRAETIDGVLAQLSKRIIHELHREFGDVDCFDWNDLLDVFGAIYADKKIPFVFIIDEWDCIFRVHKSDKEAQITYLDFLRNLLKDQSYVALAYMTGILPIKKYGEHSALNMFTEISMTDPRDYAEFTGFTEDEVKALCQKYDMSFEETKRWYDGYQLKGISVYNPRSVVMSMTGHCFNNYWTSTETFEALRVWIEMDFDHLQEKIAAMIAGEHISVNVTRFQNDMTSFHNADDVLTLLIHLGYLTYDVEEEKAWIPNHEIRREFINSIEVTQGWESVMKAIHDSNVLLEATLRCDAEKVAKMIAQSHQENTSILKYNDENSLACVIALAYYSARANYEIIRELPAGKGFADLVFIPRSNCSTPAMIIELKRNMTAGTAIDQIKQKQYPDGIRFYSGEVLLVGISYDENKGHTCCIEKISI